MDKSTLDTLSQKSREAVSCSYCFMADRAQEWGHVPQRQLDRPDDVALVPWVGPHYSTTTPRVVVMMLNPGHAPAPHKLARRDLGLQLRDGGITYQEYNSGLTPLVPKWGFGGVVRWLRALNLEPELIAFLNVALCAVADDAYFPELFETCFRRHTQNFVAALEPDVVLLCGKRELEPYVGSLKSLGAKVILTWHYRPMNTSGGKAELQRVGAKLKKLSKK